MLQTMAMMINAKNYPVAAAVLPDGFLLNNKEETYGTVVVINELFGDMIASMGSGPAALNRIRHYAPYLGPRRAPITRAGDRTVTFTNNWYELEEFSKKYERLTGMEPMDQFFPVRRRPVDPKDIETEDEDGEDICDDGPCCAHRR